MNKVILTGNLARDPEVRYTQSGKAVASFSLAVSRGWRRPADSQQPTADFINIVAWEKSAEFCGKYLTKGTRILVEGRLQTRNYETQDGAKRYAVEVVANEIEFAGAKRSDSSEGGSYSNNNYHNDSSSRNVADSSFSETHGDNHPVKSGNDDEFDIPF